MPEFHSRIDLDVAGPGAEDAVGALDSWVAARRIERSLLELVRLRASQINGCQLCLAMHARDARTAGVSQRKLDQLIAWREASGFSDRERAALGWTEAVTLVAESRVPDAVYAEAAAEFGAEELATLTMAIVAVNSWNRLAIALRMQSGEPVVAA